MERLTCKFEGLNALRELGTFNKENVCIDCTSCAACCEEFNFIRCDCSGCPIQKAFDKLADYEDAEEQGLLLRLPYNIATCGVVYYVDEKDREIYRLQADKIEIYKMMISNKFVYTIDCYDFFYEDFGKIVFTNKEEAEAALQAMQEDKR